MGLNTPLGREIVLRRNLHSARRHPITILLVSQRFGREGRTLGILARSGLLPEWHRIL